MGDFGVATACGWGRAAAHGPRARRARTPRSSASGRRPLRERDYVFAWPERLRAHPDEDWVEQPIDTFGLHYDTVENHGWYRNLDPTVEQLAGDLSDGEVLVDYSGGTGILLDRLRLRVFDRQVGMLIVDSSPKFLRVALDKFRGDERVAFRRLRCLKDEKRLQSVDEVLGDSCRAAPTPSPRPTRSTSTTTSATRWPRGRACSSRAAACVNSGNLRNPRAAENEWIIDETV